MFYENYGNGRRNQGIYYAWLFQRPDYLHWKHLLDAFKDLICNSAICSSLFLLHFHHFFLKMKYVIYEVKIKYSCILFLLYMYISETEYMYLTSGVE